MARPSDGIDIHRIGDEQLEAVAELAARFFVEEGFAVPGGGMADRLRQYRETPGTTVLVATKEQEVIGVATAATGFSLEYGRYCELEDLYVRPDARHRGLAHRLVEAAAAWASGEACTSMLVTITPKGQEAHDLLSFYSGLGFVDDGRRIIERSLSTHARRPDGTRGDPPFEERPG
jgi:GNAT superfamily N-acetyltransferase